jgi:hypothetical protein
VSVTIDLTTQELSRLKQLTGAAGDSDAAGRAVREFLRLCQLRELKGVSGKFEFEDRAEELESLESGEAPFPT